MWIFAYGSLIFRPSFAFIERRRAYVAGFARRFWQGSPDHRGVPEAPGRVVTLVEDRRAVCGGCAYRIDPDTRAATLEALDLREQAGLVRVCVPVRDAPDGPPFAEAITYVADPTNPWYLGPLDERAIADVVRQRRGPSGENAEYARRLSAALRDLDIADDHVEAIVGFLSADA
jgi:cation transport regulator ChaC